MAKLPTKPTDTVALIYRSYELDAEDCFRQHLGASLIGDPCRRKLWYSFRGCTKPAHPGRVKRLFLRGQNEEDTFTNDLRAIGCQVYTVDKETGEQFRVSACNGHFGGSLDAAILGLPEAPRTWHVGEFKTHNDKSFKALCKDGVEKSKPLHFAQMQTYMHLTEMTRALYLAVNKNDDSLYAERVHYDKAIGEAMIEKACTIIAAPEPLERISEKPDWYECKFCDHHAICHQQKVPEVHCRTCAHVTCCADGTWLCEVGGGKDVLSYADQLRGCGDHMFIPSLIPYAEMVDYDAARGVQYKLADGRTFFNCSSDNPASGCYSSKELQHLDPSLIGDGKLDDVRVTFGARVVA